MTHQTGRQWRRLFGITLTDQFTGTPWQLELERDLAPARQFIDVIIVRRQSPPLSEVDANLDLPDGLEELRRHNLLTFKSRHEALSAWTLDELTGH